MKKNNSKYAIAVILMMIVFMIIVIANSITHELPHDLVQCATAWLIVGIPVLVSSIHYLIHHNHNDDDDND